MSRILLVLGASSDVGRELLKDIWDDYDVILAHYHSDGVFLEEYNHVYGKKAVGYCADFSDMASTKQLIEDIKADGYCPEHIVCLPSVKAVPCKFAKEEWSMFEDMWNVAFRGTVLLLQAFLPNMLKQKYGRVLFMLSSYVDGMPPKYLASYTVSKYALLGLMRSLSVEYAEKGIMVNALSPEMMDTKFLNGLSEYIVMQNAAKAPRKKNLSVSEVVPMIRFLLSEGANCITGQNIVITGGK